MTMEILRGQWGEFCRKLSLDRHDWQTSIQVLSSESGAQMLSDGLPFIGLTFETDSTGDKFELSTGTGGDIYQTHSIFNPKKVAMENEPDKVGTVLNIEDESGTKTLVRFVRPASLPATFVKGDLLAK